MAESVRKRSRSSIVLAVGQVSEATLPLLRSVALARLLGGTEFGIAVALSAVAAIVEISADLGLDRSAVLAGAEADAETRMATLQSLSAIRGIVVGLVLAVLGPIVAIILHKSAAWSAFAALGLCSAVRGFANLGVKEAMQRYSYWQEGLATATLQVSWTIATVGLAFFIPDHRCMLAGIFIGQLIYVASTQILSARRWRLGWSRDYARHTIRYGAPLIPNGIALVANSLIDRIVVGAFLGVEVMGVYYTAMTAATLPRGAILRFINNLALPKFINRDPNSERPTQAFDNWLLLLTAVATVCSLGYICLARPGLALVFGLRFEPSQLLTSLIGLSLYAKFMLTLLVPPAMAAGLTRLVLATTIAASSSIIVGSGALALYPVAEAMVGGILLAEATALAWVTMRTFSVFPFDRRLGLACMAPSIVMLILIAILEWIFGPGLVINVGLVVVAGVGIAVWAIQLSHKFGLELPMPRFARGRMSS